jgi:multicomponent Na+:H+ antiporter subunit E
MRFFVLNIFMAMVWALLQGQLTASNILVGFVISYIIIGLNHRTLGSRNYSSKVIQVTTFVAFIAREILTASLSVAWLMLQPRRRIKPAIVAVPLAVHNDLGIILLSNLITLSPGTMTLDISSDRRTLYVHTITLDDADAFRYKIKTGLERRVLEVMQ